jgi:hypothetical protein
LIPNPDVTAAVERQIGKLSAEQWFDQLIGRRGQIKGVKPDSLLYKVFAIRSPRSLGRKVHIADIVMDGGFFVSKTADRKLFFQHGRMEQDLEYYPEWEKDIK